MPGARGPAALVRDGKGTYARTTNAAFVPAFALLAVLLALLPAAAASAQGGTGGAQPQATPTPSPTSFPQRVRAAGPRAPGNTTPDLVEAYGVS